MNPRIQLLAEHAGAVTFGGKQCLFGDTDIEKFAELIAQECIREIGYKSAELLDIDFYPHHQQRLKKYFGIQQ